MRAAIGLGSNTDDPRAHVERALDELDHLREVHVTAKSGLYRTRPVGPVSQRDYCNAVVLLETTLEPVELLDKLQALERRHGRAAGATRGAPLGAAPAGSGYPAARRARDSSPAPGSAASALDRARIRAGAARRSGAGVARAGAWIGGNACGACGRRGRGALALSTGRGSPVPAALSACPSSGLPAPVRRSHRAGAGATRGPRPR